MIKKSHLKKTFSLLLIMILGLLFLSGCNRAWSNSPNVELPPDYGSWPSSDSFLQSDAPSIVVHDPTSTTFPIVDVDPEGTRVPLDGGPQEAQTTAPATEPASTAPATAPPAYSTANVPSVPAATLPSATTAPTSVPNNLVISTPSGDSAAGSYNDVTIDASDVTIENKIIRGNLYITGNSRSGRTTLKNVTVAGDVVVNGSEKGVNIIDSKINAIEVNLPSETVKLNASGDSTVGEVTAFSSLALNEKDLKSSASGFNDLVVEKGSVLTVNVELAEASLESVTANAYTIFSQSGSVVSKIKTLTANAAVDLLESVKVTNLKANASGIEFAIAPTNITTKSGVREPDYIDDDYRYSDDYYDDDDDSTPVSGSRLGTPVISSDGYIVRWDSVARAYEYEVEIYFSDSTLVDSFATESRRVDLLSYAVGYGEAGRYTIKVWAISDTSRYDDSRVASKTIRIAAQGKLSKPSLGVSAALLSWNTVKHAKSYNIIISKKTGSAYNYLETISVTTVNYGVAELSKRLGAGEYRIKIQAVAVSGGLFTDSDYSAEKELKVTSTKLDAAVLTIDNATKRLLWNAVSGAAGYVLKIEGPAYSNEIDLGNLLAYDLPAFIDGKPSGTYTFWVRAYRAGGADASDWSNRAEVVYVKQLLPPVASLSGKLVSWGAVAEATGYKVTASGPNGYTETIDAGAALSFNATSLLAARPDGKYSFYVVAYRSESDYSASSNVVSIDFAAPLGKPLVSLANASLTWPQISGADGYEALITDEQTNSARVDLGKATTAAISELLEDFDSGRYTIVIKAYRAGEKSEPSNAVSVDYVKPLVLNAPVIKLTAGSKVIEWSKVENAGGYVVVATAPDKSENTFDIGNKLSFDAETAFGEGSFGEYSFYVTAYSGDTKSPASNTIIVENKEPLPEVIPAPVIENTSGYMLEWQAVEDAEGYHIVVSGPGINENYLVIGNVVEYDASEVLRGRAKGEYTLAIRAYKNGGLLISENSNRVTITFKLPLGAPSALAIDDYTLTFTGVKNAEYYTAVVEPVAAGAAEAKKTTFAGTSVSLKSIFAQLPNGEYKISVYAAENTVWDKTPENKIKHITITTPVAMPPFGLTAGNDRVSWQAYSHVSGYKVTVTKLGVGKVLEKNYEQTISAFLLEGVYHEFGIGAYDVVVKAVSGTTLYSDYTSPAFRFTNSTVPAVPSITQTGNLLSWTTNESTQNIASYTVQWLMSGSVRKEVVLTAQTASYDLSKDFSGLASGEYDVRVALKSVGGGVSYSNNIKISYQLAAITDITAQFSKDGLVLSWNIKPGYADKISSYVVSINNAGVVTEKTVAASALSAEFSKLVLYDKLDFSIKPVFRGAMASEAKGTITLQYSDKVFEPGGILSGELPKDYDGFLQLWPAISQSLTGLDIKLK